MLGIFLLGSSAFNQISVYADDYENDYNYDDDYDSEEDEDSEEDGVEDEEKSQVDMTNVTLNKKSLEGIIVGNDYWGSGIEFKVEVNSETVLNQYDNADVNIESSNEDMYFDAGLNDNTLTISTNSSGKTNLKITINEKEFKIKVKITRIGFKKNFYLIAKGKNETIAVTGGKKFKIKWKSSKPSIVSVDKKGKIKGLKEGSAVITAEINGKKLAAVVSSVPEVKKKVVNWAINYVNKNEYSQPKRMQSGYYDCSSLVWRAYNKFGYKLAGVNYAPTAADLCKFYERKKQTVKGGEDYKNVEKLKLLPGDLVFYSGEDNGRYKDIYHVEMIAGYEVYGVDDKGRPDVGLRYVKLSLGGGVSVARVKVK